MKSIPADLLARTRFSEKIAQLLRNPGLARDSNCFGTLLYLLGYPEEQKSPVYVSPRIMQVMLPERFVEVPKTEPIITDDTAVFYEAGYLSHCGICVSTTRTSPVIFHQKGYGEDFGFSTPDTCMMDMDLDCFKFFRIRNRDALTGYSKSLKT